jgi:WD40 repeat protein
MLLAHRSDPSYGIYPVWEVATGKLVGRLRAMKLQTDCVGWSPTGKEIVASGLDGNQGEFDAKVNFWSAELVNGLLPTDATRSLKLLGSLEDIALDATGTRIFLSVSEKGYQIADAVTGETRDQVDDRNQMRSTASKFVLSPNGKFLAVATAKTGPLDAKIFPGLLCVWDLEKKALKFEALQGSLARYTAFSPDGKIVAVTSDGGMNLYDVDTSKLIRSVAGGESFAFTGDGQWILEPDHRGLRAWQVKKP